LARIPSILGLTQDDDASALEYLPNDSSGSLVLNFLVARVRLKGNTPGAKAKKVRVFFRVFQAQSTGSEFNTSTTYRSFSDGMLIPVQAAHHNEMMSPAVTE